MKILKDEKILKIVLILTLSVALVLGCMGNQNVVRAEKNNQITETQKTKNTATKTPVVAYNTHIQNEGWEKDFSKTNGEIAGTSGKSLRLEAIKIKLENLENTSIRYQTHVQDIGWQDWKKDGEMSGTSGKALRLEGIKIELQNTEKYSVMYRVHVQDIGWQEWKTDGEIAGTTGKSLRLEAIQIKIIDKVEKGIICIDTLINDTYYNQEKIAISGWKMANISNTKIKVTLDNNQNIENINYTQRQDVLNAIKGYGTQKENPNPGFNFEVKLSDLKVGKHILKIAIVDENEKEIESYTKDFTIDRDVHIKYSTHIQDIGWQDWCYDGETSGTFDESLRLEAIEIKIVPKIKKSQTTIYIDNPTNQIENINQNIKGWIMTTEENTTTKILLDDKELDESKLKRTQRTDVINSVKGYGNENIYNKTPGFEIEVDFSKYSLGKHTLVVQVLKDDKILEKTTKEFTIRKQIQYTTGTYGITGLKAKGDSRGRDLKYYKYGSGTNVFFATFAIHGFEDIWAKDGQELVTIANDFYQKLISDKDFDLAEKWTIYIFPGVNLDGLNYGSTNNGPGRTTLFSQAPNNKGIDMNRCWQVGSYYTRYTDNRNYNGTSGFQAYESQYLRDFLLKNKSQNGQTMLVDLHGWTTQVIGDRDICSYYSKQFPENDRSAVGRYGNGYLINWARNSLGSTSKAAKSALIELPSAGINGHQSVLNHNYSNRYIQATLDMLKNI